MKYTVELDARYAKDSSYLQIKINEEVKENDAVGDLIGIYKECNCLEFTDMLDVDDEDVRDFIKTYFKNYRAILGFIRKMLELKMKARNWKEILEKVEKVETVEVIETGVKVNGELVSIYTNKEVAQEVAKKISYFIGV